MRGRLLGISGYVLAILLGAYGLIGGYLSDYAGSCKAAVTGTTAAASAAFDDFCGTPPRPHIPPHGPWGWIGVAGVVLGLVGLAVAVFGPNASRVTGEFDPQPDPPGLPRSMSGPQQ